MVYLTPDNQSFWNLVDPAAGGGNVELTCGGQTADFPLRQSVSLQGALAAATRFLDRDQKDPALAREAQALE